MSVIKTPPPPLLFNDTLKLVVCSVTQTPKQITQTPKQITYISDDWNKCKDFIVK